jgi:hypothetical protein
LYRGRNQSSARLKATSHPAARYFTAKRVKAYSTAACFQYLSIGVPQAQTQASAPSLTPWQLLDQFARHSNGRSLVLKLLACGCLELITQPKPARAALIHQL